MDLLFILLFLIGGIILFVLEIFVFPGTVISALSGLALLCFGIFRVFIKFGYTWGMITSFLAIVACIVLIIWVLRFDTWKKFASKSIDSKANDFKVEEFKVGDKGITISRLAPAGMAEINGQSVEVSTITSFVDPKTEIGIEKIDGNKIFVRPIE